MLCSCSVDHVKMFECCVPRCINAVCATRSFLLHGDCASYSSYTLHSLLTTCKPTTLTSQPSIIVRLSKVLWLTGDISNSQLSPLIPVAGGWTRDDICTEKLWELWAAGPSCSSALARLWTLSHHTSVGNTRTHADNWTAANCCLNVCYVSMLGVREVSSVVLLLPTSGIPGNLAAASS